MADFRTTIVDTERYSSISVMIGAVIVLISLCLSWGVVSAVTLDREGAAGHWECAASALQLDTYHLEAELRSYDFSGKCVYKPGEHEATNVYPRDYSVTGYWDETTKKAAEVFTFQGEKCTIEFACTSDPWLNDVSCTNIHASGSGGWCSQMSGQGVPVTRKGMSSDDVKSLHIALFKEIPPQIQAPEESHNYTLGWFDEKKEILIIAKAALPHDGMNLPSGAMIQFEKECTNCSGTNGKELFLANMTPSGYANVPHDFHYPLWESNATKWWRVRARAFYLGTGKWSNWVNFQLNRQSVKIYKPENNKVISSDVKVQIDARNTDADVSLHWFYNGPDKTKPHWPAPRDILAKIDHTQGPVTIPIEKFEDGFWSLRAEAQGDSKKADDTVAFEVRRNKFKVSSAKPMQFKAKPPAIELVNPQKFYAEGDKILFRITQPVSKKARMEFQRYDRGVWRFSTEPLAGAALNSVNIADDGTLKTISVKTPGKWRVRCLPDAPGASWSEWVRFMVKPQNTPIVSKAPTTPLKKKEPVKTVSIQKKLTLAPKKGLAAVPIIEAPGQGQAFVVLSKPVQIKVRAKHANDQTAIFEFQRDKKAVGVDAKQRTHNGETTAWFTTALDGDWRVRTRLESKDASWSGWRDFKVNRISAEKKQFTIKE